MRRPGKGNGQPGDALPGQGLHGHLDLARPGNRAAAGKPPAPRMCETCFARFRELQDQVQPCRVKGCDRTWMWTKGMQLEAAVHNRTRVPSRMCDECAAQMTTLQDRAMPCRSPGCDGTFVWTAFAQLEALVQKEAEPHRMCDTCHAQYSRLTDEAQPCRVPGCRGTWVWTRWAQMEALRRGKKKPPRRLCADCAKDVTALEPLEVKCKHDGCTSMWTWTPEMQLSAVKRGFDLSRYPERMCDSCKSFVDHAATQTLHCEKCGKDIVWTREHQLHVHLGKWEKPTVCADCHPR